MICPVCIDICFPHHLPPSRLVKSCRSGLAIKAAGFGPLPPQIGHPVLNRVRGILYDYQRSPETTPGAPQNGAKRGRRGTKRRPETARRTTKPITGDHMTASDPPKTPVATRMGTHTHTRTQPTATSSHFLASFGHPNTTQERVQNDPKSKRKTKRRTEAIQDDQVSVLERSWVVWVRHVEAENSGKY